MENQVQKVAAGRWVARFSDALLSGAPELGDAELGEWLRARGLFYLWDEPRLPEEARAVLSDARSATAAHNHLRLAWFQDVVSALSPIPVCPLKGIDLLGRVYSHDIGLRPMLDVDILVPAEEFGRAVDRLADALEMGTVPEGIDRGYHTTLTGRGLNLEVHRCLDIRHAPRSTWKRLDPGQATLHGLPVSLLSDPMTLAHLIAHFVKHGPFVSLRWVVDILAWVDRGVDLADLAAAAAHIGATRTVMAGVVAVRGAVGGEFLEGYEGLVSVPDRVAVRANQRLSWGRRTGQPFAAQVPDYATWRRFATSLLLSDSPKDVAWFLAHRVLGKTRWSEATRKGAEVRRRSS